MPIKKFFATTVSQVSKFFELILIIEWLNSSKKKSTITYFYVNLAKFILFNKAKGSDIKWLCFVIKKTLDKKLKTNILHYFQKFT